MTYMQNFTKIFIWNIEVHNALLVQNAMSGNISVKICEHIGVFLITIYKHTTKKKHSMLFFMMCLEQNHCWILQFLYVFCLLRDPKPLGLWNNVMVKLEIISIPLFFPNPKGILSGPNE